MRIVSGHCDSCGNVQCLCHLIVADLKAEIRTLRSAFDDRVKVIRLQLADKEALQAELRAAVGDRDQAREEAVHQNDLLKAAQERAETAERDADHLRNSLLVLANATIVKWKERAETAERERDDARASDETNQQRWMRLDRHLKTAEAQSAQQAATIARMRELLRVTYTDEWIDKALAADPPAPPVSDGLEHAIARIPGEPPIRWETSKDGWHKQDTMPETPRCEQCGVEVRAILCEDCSEWSLRQQANDPPVSDAPDTREPCYWPNCERGAGTGKCPPNPDCESSDAAPPTPDAERVLRCTCAWAGGYDSLCPYHGDCATDAAGEDIR